MLEIIKTSAERLLPLLKEMRHHLHVHPELSFQEFQTAVFIETKLKELGITEFRRTGKTGITTVIKGQNPDSKCVALRADIDALPIQEENEVSYRSINENVMHACGHDVHTTCLLGAAAILQQNKNQFEGSVKLIFQPGEEKSPGGASILIKEGILKDPAPSAIFALHVDPDLPSGTVGFKSGPYMAASDEIHITVKGKGGHAALPHLTIDPISVSALIITALQQVVSRKANPLLPTVLSFGTIHGGKANNVIPDEVNFSGTLRTFDENWRKEAKEIIKKTVLNICSIYGATAEIFIPSGYPFLQNNKSLTEKAISDASILLGQENVNHLDLRMTSEDFSFYAQKVPSCFFRLGTNKENTHFLNSVHSPKFDIDESALVIGTQMMSWLAIQTLSNHEIY